MYRTERENKKEWIKELQSVVDPKGHIAYIGTPWHPDDCYSITPPPRKYPYGSIDIPTLTEERMKEIRKNQLESFFQAQYYLEHIPDVDRIFDSPNLGDLEPRYLAKANIKGYYDPAFGGQDYSVLTIGCEWFGKFYIIGGHLWKDTIDKSYNKIAVYYHSYKISLRFLLCWKL